MTILPDELIDQEVKFICNRYKMGPESVKKIINETLQKHPKLIKKIQTINNQDLTRLNAYKCFIKEVKKTIYYQLRQYHQDVASENNLKQRLADEKNGLSENLLKDLLASHVSSKERLPYYDDFYSQLFALIDSPQTIVDIGCGLNPLSYPFKKSASLKNYLAIDKDSSVINVLQQFAHHLQPIQLKPVCMEISDIVWSDFLFQSTQFDLAIMLKLIPVIHRQSKSAMTQLCQVPAKRIILTGNIEAMTRRENIRRREEQVLRNFIKMMGRDILGYIQIDNEFGMMI